MPISTVLFWLVIMQSGFGGATIPFDSRAKCEEQARILMNRAYNPLAQTKYNTKIDAYCVESSMEFPF